MSFEQLNLAEPLMRALRQEGYTMPTPIQSKAIPVILSNSDIIGTAQTGTGKTAAFALPILNKLWLKKTNGNLTRNISTLIITPTRELAVQISDSFNTYGRFTGLKNILIYGGVSQRPQEQALRNGAPIVIATPGRLLDLIGQRLVRLQNLDTLILDEADRMLDMGFINDIRKIITYVPKQRQTLMFSATMPPEIRKLASDILVNPENIAVNPVSSAAKTINQSVYMVDRSRKKNLLLHLLDNESIDNAIVFTRTKHGADRITKEIVKSGINAEVIHGDKSQQARQRALNNFKHRKTRILVATDIAARGIDIEELSHVINFDMPDVPETYVHRIGRTGRAGMTGNALSFCDREEVSSLRQINRLTAGKIAVIESHPFISNTEQRETQENKTTAFTHKKKPFFQQRKKHFRR